MAQPPDPVDPAPPEGGRTSGGAGAVPPPAAPSPGSPDGPGEEGEGFPRLSPYLKLLRRLVRSVTSIFQAHVMVVQDEAATEARRVATGLVLLAGMAVLLVLTTLLGGVAALALVQRVTGLPWLESIALTAAGSALLAFLLGTFGWLFLRRPLLPRSRKLLHSTFDGLLKG